MIFWLKRPIDEEAQKEEASIYLDQLLKATGLMKDYTEVREALHAGKVKVNGEVIFSRTKLIYEDDLISFGEEHVKVYGKKKAKEQADFKHKEETGTIETVLHGNAINKWVEKKIEKPKFKKKK